MSDELLSSRLIFLNFPIPEVLGDIWWQNPFLKEVAPTELGEIFMLFYLFKGNNSTSALWVLREDEVYQGLHLLV